MAIQASGRDGRSSAAVIRNFEFPLRRRNVEPRQGFSLQVPYLEISPGKAIGVFGISGSGKTTLFDVLAGVIRSQVETVVRESFPKVGYLMHRSGLMPWLSVRDNLLVEQKLRGRQVDIGSFVDVLCKLNLKEEVLEKRCLELSYGMLQRVDVALALSFEVDLLIMDEGLSGLNFVSKLAASTLIRKHISERGMACVFTSHFPSDVLRLADTVVQVADGVVGEETTLGLSALTRLNFSDVELLGAQECAAMLNRFYS